MTAEVSLLPREHGAYGQLAFPLVTAFGLTMPTWPALLTAAAAVFAFLAHEPLLVLLGRRGPRARRERWRQAMVWCVAAAAGALTAGLSALWLASPGTRWSFIPPLALTAVVGGMLAGNREKTTAGEAVVAMALSAVALPVCVTGGAGWSTGLSVSLAFAALFTAATLSVRLVIARVRGGGDVATVRALTRLLCGVILAVCIAFAWAAVRGVLPWPTLLAVVPGLLVVGGLAARPPSPTRLRAVGWALVSTAAVAALVLVATLERAPWEPR